MTKRIPILPETAIERLTNTINEVAPDNDAPIPIAIAHEVSGTVKEKRWTVNTHIRRPGKYDLDWEIAHADLDYAASWAARLILRDPTVAKHAPS